MFLDEKAWVGWRAVVGGKRGRGMKEGGGLSGKRRVGVVVVGWVERGVRRG